MLVREVDLWGRVVLIDEDHRVYCPDCWEFVTLADLAAPTNRHRVGRRPRPGAIFRVEFGYEGFLQEPNVNEVGF